MPEALSQTRRSERLNDGPFVVVINRTSRPLTVQVDGQQWVMKPGRNTGISHVVAERAVKQHPRKGTFDRRLSGGESLLVVEGFTPPELCTPIPPGQEHLGDDLVDRKQHPNAVGTATEMLPERRRVEERNPFEHESHEISMIGGFDDLPS